MRHSRLGVWFCAGILGLAALGCTGDDDDSADKDNDETTTTTEGSDDGGDGGDAATAEDYIDALAESADDGSSTPEENRCLAEAYVTAIGVEGFVKAGVTPDEIRDDPDASPETMGLTFSDDEAATLYDEVSQCRDMREFLVETFTEDGGYTDEQVDCLREGLDDDLVERFMISIITEAGPDYEPPADVSSDLAAVMTQCGMAG